MKEIIVSKQESGQRADKYVRKVLADAPLSFIYKIFRKKDIKVNGKWVKIETMVYENDVVRIFVTDEQLAEFIKKPKPIENIKADFSIIYEDDNVMIVNKPKGILVHGDLSEKRLTLTNQVQNYLYLKGEYDPGDSLAFSPSPAHRLDRNTSGLVVFAKNLEALKLVTELIKTREDIKKEYLALVLGSVDKSGKIDLALRKDEKIGLVIVDQKSKDAKAALTLYQVQESFKDVTLVRVELVTGRTHQIRAHFSAIKHPIIGDGKYGDFAANRTFKNQFNYEHQFLHAYRLSFGKISGILSNLSGKIFTGPLYAKEKEILEMLRKE